jgi:hypothetical protein
MFAFPIGNKKKKVYRVLALWIHNWRRGEQGAVAMLMAMVLFLGMAFVGLAIDYSRYVNDVHLAKSFGDEVSLTGAAACRKRFLEERKNGIPVNAAETAAIEAGEYHGGLHFDWNKERHEKNGGMAMGKQDLKAKILYPPNGPEPQGTYCQFSLTTQGKMQTSFMGLFGFPQLTFTEKTTALSVLEEGPQAKLEIDFLIDTSSSMSTIADPKDRDLVVALTQSEESADPQAGNGCIFICHSRDALMPGPISRRVQAIINEPDSSPGLMFNAIYRIGSSSNYNGGSRSVRIRKQPGKFLRSYENKNRDSLCNTSCDANGCNPGSGVCTRQGERLFAYGDVLKYFDIKLKSDQIITNLSQMKSLLMPYQNRVKVAFHTFSQLYSSTYSTGIVKTQEPFFGSEDSDLLSELRFAHVSDTFLNYQVPNMGIPETPYMYPTTAQGKTAPVYGVNSRGYSQTEQEIWGLGYSRLSRIMPDKIRARTDIPGAMREMLAKIKRRPKPDALTKQVLVLMTDGIVNMSTEPFLINPTAVCKPFHDEGIVVMVLHSYYRFHPGSTVSVSVYKAAGGTAATLTRDNIDQEEKNANGLKLKETLAQCASPNKNAKPNQEPTYYYPANDIAQLASVFSDLFNDLINIKVDTVPVFISE